MSNENLTSRLVDLSVSWAARAAKLDCDADDLAVELDDKIRQAPGHVDLVELRQSYQWRINDLRAKAARNAHRSDLASEAGMFAMAPLDRTDPEFMREYGPLYAECHKQGRYVTMEDLGVDYLEETEGD